MSSLIRKFKSMDMRIKGFYGAKARWWLNSVQYSKNHSTGYSEAEKKWAYKHGFLPEIVERYGINDSNVKDFISVHDYCYIYPVNDIFRKWIKDRVTTRNVLKPYKEYLPYQYYHLYLRDGETMIIKLGDCPEQYGETMDDVLNLIKEKGKTALRKTSGLSCEKIEYRDGAYYFNGEKISEKKLAKKLHEMARTSIYVLTEYVEVAADYRAEKETATSLLRLMVYNKYADNPKIGQAYLRVSPQEGTVDIDDMEERTGDNVEEFSGDSEDQKEINSDDGVYEKNFMEDQTVLPKKGKPSKIARFYYYPVDVETGEIGSGKHLDDKNHIEEGFEFTGADGKRVEKIPGWQKLNDTIIEICRFIPQIELMGVDILITEDGFKLVDFSDQPYYPQVIGFNEEMTEYFRMKVDQKYEQAKDPEFRRNNFRKKSDTFLWIRLAKLFCPPNMRPLIYKWWYVTVRDDFFSHNGVSLKDKIWAYKHGFLSYRLPQYGITRENYQNFISDYDYRYLRHINNKYRVWLEDKITVKYICSRYSQFFPKYYYHVSVRNGEKRIIPLMDLPDYCSNDLESVFELAKHEGALACKPQRGSQGQGFYKLSYHDGKYFLNHEEATREDILKILGDPDSQYLITEYIQQHHVIDNIYSGAVNTLRIITFMKDGKTPQIGNAYMRVGSKKTGAVDNMGAGGMFVQVDMETGHFHNGKIITENNIVPCSNHPDTGALLEGDLPNWDIIKQGVIDLNKEMPQLEYLGFDVAITEDGMKLPEINRAPGYPKIETFQRPTIDYLLYKKSVKMKNNNIKKTKW